MATIGSIRARYLLTAALAFSPSLGCGSGDSLTVRSESDDYHHDAPSSALTPSKPTQVEISESEVPLFCADERVPGFQYAEEDDFWLGPQDEIQLTVDGLDYLTFQDLASDSFVYSRNAAVLPDPAGYLRSLEGHYVIGYNAAESCVTRVRLPNRQLLSATRSIRLVANLDASASTLRTQFDVREPATGADFSTSLTVFDSLGEPRTLDIYFRKKAHERWAYHVVIDGADSHQGTPGVLTEVGGGELEFDGSGALYRADDYGVEVRFRAADLVQQIQVFLGDDIVNDGSTGLSGTTGFASQHEIFVQLQDGFPQGTVDGVSQLPDQRIAVEFTNGNLVGLVGFALARFAREPELERIHDGYARPSELSGGARLAGPMEPGYGKVTMRGHSSGD